MESSTATSLSGDALAKTLSLNAHAERTHKKLGLQHDPLGSPTAQARYKKNQQQEEEEEEEE